MALSLAGPAFYGEDQDRHFARAWLLANGDWSQLSVGLIASQGLRTLSGLWFALVAAAMQVAPGPDALYTTFDVLILLGAIPLWYLARSLTSARVAWVAAALYLASSGRIESAWLGMHSTAVIPFGILLHLALLRVVRQPTWLAGLAVAALLPVVLSLHLSWAAFGLAIVALLAWRLPRVSFRTPAPLLLTRRLANARVWAAGAGIIVLAEGVGAGWGVDGVLLATMNLATAVGEHTGLVTPVGRGTPIERVLLFVLLPLVVIGAREVWTGRAVADAEPGADERRDRLRAWVFIVLGVQLAVAWAGVLEWRTTSNNIWRYRQLTALVPVFAVLGALGVCRAAAWIREHTRLPLGHGAVAGGLTLVLGAAHVGLLAYGHRGDAWRASGSSIRAELRSTVARTRARWGYGQDWFRTAVFTAKGDSARMDPGVERPRWEYLVDWMFRSGPRDDSHLDGMVLYLAEPASELSERLHATQTIADSMVLGRETAYLCRRSARHLLPVQPYFLTYGPRRGPNHFLAGPPGELVQRQVVSGGRRYPLIASNVELPAGEYLAVLGEVVLEQEDSALVVGARLYGRAFAVKRYASRVRNPYVHVSARDGRTLRLDLAADTLAGRLSYRGTAVLEGWAEGDAEAVVLGFDTPPGPDSTGKVWVRLQP